MQKPTMKQIMRKNQRRATMCEKSKLEFACGTISGTDLENVDIQYQFKALLEEITQPLLGLSVTFESPLVYSELTTRFYGSLVSLCIPYDKKYSLPEMLDIICTNYHCSNVSIFEHALNVDLIRDLDSLRQYINNKK